MACRFAGDRAYSDLRLGATSGPRGHEGGGRGLARVQKTCALQPSPRYAFPSSQCWPHSPRGCGSADNSDQGDASNEQGAQEAGAPDAGAGDATTQAPDANDAASTADATLTDGSGDASPPPDARADAADAGRGAPDATDAAPDATDAGVSDAGSPDAAPDAADAAGLADAAPDAKAPAEDACAASTCQTLGATCGTPPDGCGHLLASCGSCSAPTTCGATGVAFQCACPTGTWTAGPLTTFGGGAYGTSIGTYGSRVDMAVIAFNGPGAGPPFDALVGTAPLPGLGAWAGGVVKGGSGLQGLVLAVDPNGADHTVYTMAGPVANTWLLNESTGNGAVWTTTQIASGDYTACIGVPSPAVAIDSSGTVHVLYDSCGDGHQHYASRASGATTWQNTTLAFGSSAPSAIAVDTLGGLYGVVGTTDPTIQILLGYRAPGLAWPSTFTAIDPAGAVTTNPGTTSGSVAAAAVAVDGSRTAYVAYATAVVSAQSAETTQTVRVGVQQSGGSWSFTTLDGPNGSSPRTPARSVALALSATGVPHVAYVNGDGNKLVHAVRGSTGWTSETVDTASGMSDVSIAVDASGGVEISYATTVTNYAYRCP